jgi:hypothetical protein
MRQYERGPDGTWHDGLLIEMLRGDLRESDVTGIGFAALEDARVHDG